MNGWAVLFALVVGCLLWAIVDRIAEAMEKVSAREKDHEEALKTAIEYINTLEKKNKK